VGKRDFGTEVGGRGLAKGAGGGSLEDNCVGNERERTICLRKGHQFIVEETEEKRRKISQPVRRELSERQVLKSKEGEPLHRKEKKKTVAEGEGRFLRA